MLHFSAENMNVFWELATSNLLTLMKSLNESNVPKAKTKFRNQFDSEVPVDSTKKVQLSDHTKTEHQAFSVFEAIIDCSFRN